MAPVQEYDDTSLYSNFHKNSFVMPTLNSFEESLIVKPHNLKFIIIITRDFPAMDKTSYLSLIGLEQLAYAN
jgi:deoxyribodipyrimidine photo-lyase